MPTTDNRSLITDNLPTPFPSPSLRASSEAGGESSSSARHRRPLGNSPHGDCHATVPMLAS